jgi:preprotein translocase subunit Sec63
VTVPVPVLESSLTTDGGLSSLQVAMYATVLSVLLGALFYHFWHAWRVYPRRSVVTGAFSSEEGASRRGT